MKNLILKTALIFTLLFTVSYAQAQCSSRCAKSCSKDTDIISQLNVELKKSLYKTVVTVDKEGNLKRKDSNGNTFEYSLKDVKEVSSENDGLRNMMIHLEKGKKSNGIVEGKKVESELNVVAFANPNDCKKAISLFKKLVEKYN